LKRRVEKLEKIKKLSEYAAVIIIDEGKPLPDNIGPGTVIIIDDLRSQAAQERKRRIKQGKAFS
jgi:hypothetical protein